jgi:hypothetical protein
MQHGFSCRGDTKDEQIKEAVEKAFEKIYAFISKILA